MKPLWRLRSGRFLGWRTHDDQLYDADGAHLGYCVKGFAYSNDGLALGEIHDGEWIGKRETVIYPTGTRQAALGSTDAAGMPDRVGNALTGWTDPEL